MVFFEKKHTPGCIGHFGRNWPLVLAIGILLLSSACNVTRFLDRSKGEMFLVKNEIKLEKSGSKIKNKSNLAYELLQLARQKPNKKFFGIPRQYFYYTAQDTVDKSTIGMSGERVKQRLLAEEPAILDTSLVEQSVQIMKAHLQNKGYFFAEVEARIKTNKEKTKATVIYHVKPDGRFTIDSIRFISKDTAIQRILDQISQESFLKPGAPIDRSLYQQEVQRITRYLRDHGYSNFYPQYISNLQATDSSNTELKASMILEVLLPPGRTYHQRFYIGNVFVDTNYDPYVGNAHKSDTLIEDIFFKMEPGKEFNIKPRTILNSVFIRPGQLYSQQNIDNSVRQLTSLGVFRPPIIRTSESPSDSTTLDFEILLTPNKKWEIGADFDLSTTERKNVGSANLLGISVSPSIRNRNFLKGAELFSFNTDLGIELALLREGSSLINTVDFRMQADLYLPRLANYLGIWKGLRKTGLLSEQKYQRMRQQANSRFSSSYNLLVLLDNYRLQFANVSFGYDYPATQNQRLLINHLGFDLIVPQITPGSRFDSLLNQQPLLRNSFSRQFISGILFRDLTFYKSTATSTSASHWFFRHNIDISGLEAMAANVLYHLVGSPQQDLNFFGIEFSHYLKYEFDVRRTWSFSPNRALVARLNLGAVVPFYNSNTTPYVKQFYAGGPYSLRGWYARSVGPGLYHDPSTDLPINRSLFYQTGDIKLEANLEYRFLMLRPFNLFKLYGAVFFDAGNVWLRKEDSNRPGSQFSLSRKFSEGQIVQDKFFNELAINTGFGTRWDFTYFILRLDIGLPIRNHYPNAQNRYWRRLSDIDPWKDKVFQLALGYPF